MYKTDPTDALERFEAVVMLEETRDKRDYTFQSLKFIVLLAMQLGKFDQMLSSTKRLLSMAPQVSKNDLSEAVNAI